MPVSDGRWNVGSKGVILDIKRGKEILQVVDQVEIGLGKKLKEVDIQTHQWRKKTKLADREHIQVKYICWIFLTGSPPIKIFLGEIPQFWWPQGQKYWGKLEVHFRKGETSNLTKSGRSRSADWQIRGMRPETTEYCNERLRRQTRKDKVTGQRNALFKPCVKILSLDEKDVKGAEKEEFLRQDRTPQDIAKCIFMTRVPSFAQAKGLSDKNEEEKNQNPQMKQENLAS